MEDEAIPAMPVLIEESGSQLAYKRSAFAASNLMHEAEYCDSMADHLQKSNSPHKVPNKLPAQAM